MPVQSGFTPLQWKNGINPKSQGSFQNFMKQLADWANNIQQQVNSLLLTGSQSKAFGTVSTNQTFDCSHASSVVLSLGLSTNVALTLSNLGVGIPVWITMNNTAPSVTFYIFASTLGGTTYSVLAIGTAGVFNMGSGFLTGTGATYYTFFGNSLASGPALNLSVT